MIRGFVRAVLMLAAVGLTGIAEAQPLGTFSWQLAPYCNVVTVSVTQNGSTYTLDGYDTQCGGSSSRAPATGIAVPNPSGTHLRITNFGGNSQMVMRSANGTRTAPTATQINDVLFEVDANGHTGTGFTTGGRATMLVRSTQDWTSTANGTAIDFFTTPNGSTVPQQRMVLTHDGQVGIGRSVVQQTLDVDGDVRVGDSTGTAGCVQDRNGTVIAGTCSSDARFKQHIEPIGDVLDKFARLRPVTFLWRTTEFADRHFGSQESFGLIAQDVEDLFPDLVATDTEGYKAVNYSKLPLLTIQAVRELKAANDALQQRLEQQQAEIEALKRALRGSAQPR